MPRYGGSAIGQGYASAGEDIGRGIAAIGIHAHKEHQDAEAVQGLLDIARRLQYPDQKSGKPANFFKDDQLQYIQRLIDQKKYKAAGAAEAAMGIGKDMYTRVQTAAAKQAAAAAVIEAKQAAAAQKAAAVKGALEHGPVIYQDKTGRRYIGDISSGQYANDPALPRDSGGQTTTEQQNYNKAILSKQEADQHVMRTGFAAGLKAMNTSPQDLYDTNKVQPMSFVPGRGFFPVANYMPDKSEPRSRDPNTLSADPSMTAPDVTHVRVGYVPPSKEVFARGDKKNLPVDPGNPGHMLTIGEFNALRDTQAKLAGSTANAAWQWMNTSPQTTQTDFDGNPWTENSIKLYNERLPKIRKRFSSDIAKGFELPGEGDTAPKELNIPKYVPPETRTAPAQTPDPGFVVVPGVAPKDDTEVSDEAAAQNEGY